MAAAPIAVKWWLQMATVRSSAPQIVDLTEASRSPAGSAAAPISAPSAIDTATSIGIPDDAAGDLEGGHARVVHGGDAAADDGAAEPAGAGDPVAQRRRQADAGQHDRGKKGEDGQEDVVAGRQPGREGEHGDEVRRPDAEPGCDRRHAQPDMAHDPARPAHVLRRLTAVNEARVQTIAARTTRRRSCCSTMQV